MLRDTLGQSKPVIGTVHLMPLPGSAKWQGQLGPVIERAEQEAMALASAGVHALLLENTFDAPFPQQHIDTAGAIAMAQIAHHIQHLTPLPLGITVYQNNPEAALAVALNVGASFIRVPVMVGTMITEAGMIAGRLHELCAYRDKLKLPPDAVRIFADISTHHVVPAPSMQSPWRSPDAYLLRVAQAIAKHNVAHGLIVSQAELPPEAIATLNEALVLPILVGDTFTPETIGAYHAAANGILLGSGIQKALPNARMASHEPFDHPAVDVIKVERLMHALQTGGLPAYSEVGRPPLGGYENNPMGKEMADIAMPPASCPFSQGQVEREPLVSR